MPMAKEVNQFYSRQPADQEPIENWSKLLLVRRVLLKLSGKKEPLLDLKRKLITVARNQSNFDLAKKLLQQCEADSGIVLLETLETNLSIIKSVQVPIDEKVGYYGESLELIEQYEVILN